MSTEEPSHKPDLTGQVRQRPVYLNLFHIRQPVPAISSILHRVSGAVLFLAGIPLLLWMVELSLRSPEAFEQLRACVSNPLGKLVLIGFIWAYVYHTFAGLRHLFLDLHLGTSLPAARLSATIAIVASVLLALIIAVRIW